MMYFRWLAATVVIGIACCLLLVPKSETPVPTTPTVNIVLKVEHPLNGSVLFWQDGLLVRPINRHTGSHLTHAAILLDGYIYEAVPPCVHKVLLKDYIEKMKAKGQKPAMQKRNFKWFIMEPNKQYTKSDIAAMVKYAETQLGRPYMLRGFEKKITKGIFCSQLVSDVLERGGRIKSGSYRESPGSLYEKILTLYTRGK